MRNLRGWGTIQSFQMVELQEILGEEIDGKVVSPHFVEASGKETVTSKPFRGCLDWARPLGRTAEDASW